MPIPVRVSAIWRLVALLERSGAATSDPSAVRAESNRRQRLSRLPIARLVVGRPDRGARIEQTLATLNEATALPIRLYRPHAASPHERLPVVINFHGGGWVAGDPRQSEWWCSSVAAKAGVVVASVAYRLAPEHAFPTAVQDCYAATEWIVAHADELGIDGERVAVMGDSAGGNLAAVVSILARDRHGPAIGLQILIYPAVELRDEFPSEIEHAHAPVLTKAGMDRHRELYLAGADATDPLASPLRAVHEGLPPALIQTAQYDPLRDQGAAYASALRAAGVQTRLTNYRDAVHGYISIPGLVPQARAALSEVVTELGCVLAPRF